MRVFSKVIYLMILSSSCLCLKSIASQRVCCGDAEMTTPDGWGVQCVEGFCAVYTEIDDHEWQVKIGFSPQMQQFIIFSVQHRDLEGVYFPENLKTVLVVDDKDFDAIGGMQNIDGELAVILDNSIKLMTSLSEANYIGLKAAMNESDQYVDIARFELRNISGALQWLNTCMQIGVDSIVTISEQGTSLNR